MTAWLLLWLTATAPAAELAGVTLPDTTVASDGAALVLNGLGLREKYWIDIYVGGLYLPEKSTDASGIIKSDVPKTIEMRFIYRKVTQKQAIEVFREGLLKNPETAALTAEIAQLESMFDADMVRGDKVTIAYVPGKGTSFTINGTNRGTIAGTAFMRGIMRIFVGPAPASEKLKAGMLGR